MTQEEKQLLLKDLCARLPYGVICKSKSYRNILFDSTHISLIESEEIKPYLRPLSSMTEEEKADLEAYSKQEFDKYADNVLNHVDKDTTRYSQIALIYKDIDWFNKHHFDYRGLIPMGLAIEAPNNMYNT